MALLSFSYDDERVTETLDYNDSSIHKLVKN